MLNSNEPIKVAHLKKLAQYLNSALVKESNSFFESKKNCGLWYSEDHSNQKKYGQFLLDFAKYLSDWKVQKNKKVVNV